MKEKITVIIVLTSIVALLFHHQSQNNNTQLTSIQDDLSNQSEISLTSLELIVDELDSPLEKSIPIDECNVDVIATDSLEFKDAFTYFRKCLGSNQEFTWKGQSYLTLLAEEVEIDVIKVNDSTIVKKVNESDLEVVSH